jgi:uncharacterized protein involved in exopolysaccharide biosynthesis
MKPAPTPREQLERLWVMTRRSLAFWRRGLVLFVVGSALAAAFVFTRPRSWTSETVILYQETIRSSDVVGGDGSSEGARRVGARLRELLLSRANLEPIIHDMNLYPDKIIRGESIEAVVEMRKFIVFRAQEGDTYAIDFTGDTPQLAQEVTRRLGDVIIQETTTRREEKAKALKEFLSAESLRTQAELKQKEDDLARFVALHPEFTTRLQGLPGQPAPPGGGVGASAVPPGVTDPNLAFLYARAARIQRQLSGKGPSVGIPKPAPSFQPPPDSAELVAARRNLADKLALYTDKHPDVISARSRLQAAEAAQAAANQAAYDAYLQVQQDDPGPPQGTVDEAQLRRDLANIQALIAQRRGTSLATAAGDAGVSAATGPVAGNVELELEFRRLQQGVSESRDRQQELEARLFRASVAASSVMDDRNVQCSVLDPAYLPVRPSSKPRSMLLAGLLAACIALAMGLMFGSAAFDDRIYDQQDIERLDILPVIAVIPKSPTPIRQLPAGSARRS